MVGDSTDLCVNYLKKSQLQSTGFPATLEIRENLENEFSIFQSGKPQGIWEKHQKSGKTQGICDNYPERKGFRLAVWCRPMCVLCHVSKLCSLTDWLKWLL